MHCPKCGQRQISEETRFCSKCGFLLTGIAEVVSNEGVLLRAADANFPSSPRKKGIKQGIFFFLLMAFLIVPLTVAVSIGFRAGPTLAIIIAIMATAAAFLRIIYALMFESNIPGGNTLEENLIGGSRKFFNNQDSPRKLPADQSIPVSAYASPAGTWRDTNDLQPVGSVTDNTTKLLEKDQETQ